MKTFITRLVAAIALIFIILWVIDTWDIDRSSALAFFVGGYSWYLVASFIKGDR